MTEKMGQGIRLEEDQMDVFENLHDFFHPRDSDDSWVHKDSPFQGITMALKKQVQQKGKSTSLVGRAIGYADSTAAEVAAWAFDYCSNERITIDRKEGNYIRFPVDSEGKDRFNERRFATIKNFPFPVAKREVVFKSILRKNENRGYSLAILSVPEGEKIDYGGGMGKLVRADTKGIFTCTNVKSLGNIPQCKMEFLCYGNAQGRIPKSTVERILPKLLGFAEEARNSFDRSTEVDEFHLSSLARIIDQEEQTFTAEETEAIDRGKKFFMKCRYKSQKFDDFPVDEDSRVTVKTTTVKGDKQASGIGEAFFDAPIEECAAYIWKKDLRSKLALLKERKVLEQQIVSLSNHSMLYSSSRNFGIPGVSTRDWRWFCVWKKEDDGKTIWLTYEDTNRLDKDFPLKPGVVRANSKSGESGRR